MATQIGNTTREELVQAGVQAAIAGSRGQFTNFLPGSPVMVFIEATANVALVLQSELNRVIEEVEKNRLAIFDIERRVGQYAVGLATVRLSGLYSEPFQLPSGFELKANGIGFETTEDLIIPPYTISGEVTVAALEVGESGNIPGESVLTYPFLDRVESISIHEAIAGGVNAETAQDWKDRIRREIRVRDTLISEEDFRLRVEEELGKGSTALAIGRLKPDLASYENGYVAVFALNPDGSLINSSQRARLQSELNRLAAMAQVSVNDLNLFSVRVGVYAVMNSNASVLSEQIKILVENHMRPGNLPPGTPVLNKRIEYEVQGIQGVLKGLVSVTLNGFEQAQSVPFKWSVARMQSLVVRLVDSIQGDEFKFEFDYE
ncbi:MAG: hypothetical protein F6J98_02145 [Moorea sp. SIO4G2]|nr:hypothetical protein [Moorena sp. SIO4G2]